MASSQERRAVRLAGGLANLVAVAGFFALIVGVVLPINQLTQPGATVLVDVSDPVMNSLELPPASTAIDASVSLSSVGPARLSVLSLPAPMRLLSEAPALVRAVLAAAGGWLLRWILLKVCAGTPFADGVAARITGLGLVALGFAVVPHVTEYVAATSVLHHVGAAGTSTTIRAPVVVGDLGMGLLAAILFVVAGVFRHGAVLRQDTEGLV